MNFYEKINELLKENLTENCFNFWIALNDKVPSAWEKLSSSSKKYHKRSDSSIPTIAEHTYEMLYSASKVYRLFGMTQKTIDCDILLMGVVLHDIIKYGNENENEHTLREHDQLIADRINNRREIFKTIFNDEQLDILIEMVRYHSGRWSTDVKDINTFDFKDHHPYVLFLHMLDMLSTADCLKFT